MPPPPPNEAVLLLKVLFVTVSVPRLERPPPALLSIVLSSSVTVPSRLTPTPILPLTVTFVTAAVPSLAQKPAPLNVADPYATGVYSYLSAGGMSAPQALAEPINNTLFFAGEATETSGHTGTVHGALMTGKRAAEEIIKALPAK